MDWSSAFAAARSYADFLDRYAAPAHRARWDNRLAHLSLSDEQTTLLSGFVREMRVLVLAGAWCGDCINQVPIFDRFAAAAPRIDLRVLDRDARLDVAEALSINGGKRVPVVVFLSEDSFEVARYGERNLASYRRLAARRLGASCPTGLVLPDESETLDDVREWLDEFERVQLILRLSPRLRERHGD